MDGFNDWLQQASGYLSGNELACAAPGSIYVFWFALIAPVTIYFVGNLWGVLTDSRPGNAVVPLVISIVLGLVQFALIHGCADPVSPGGYVDEALRTAATVFLNWFVALSGQNMLFGRNRARLTGAEGEKRRGWLDKW